MKPINLALGLLLLAVTVAPAAADDDGRPLRLDWRRRDNGNHYGWYKHGDKSGNRWSDRWTGRVTPQQTPEIDPGMLRGGMVLLVGGLLALTDRRRRS